MNAVFRHSYKLACIKVLTSMHMDNGSSFGFSLVIRQFCRYMPCSAHSCKLICRSIWPTGLLDWELGLHGAHSKNLQKGLYLVRLIWKISNLQSHRSCLSKMLNVWHLHSVECEGPHSNWVRCLAFRMILLCQNRYSHNPRWFYNLMLCSNYLWDIFSGKSVRKCSMVSPLSRTGGFGSYVILWKRFVSVI